MTTHAIEAYGGLRFPRSSLVRAAETLNSGQVPLNADHDLARPLRVRNLRAWVDDGEDGYARLRLKYEIHPDDAHYLDTRMAMSAMISTPIEGREDIVIENPIIELRGDHAWFPDTALIQAGRLIAHQSGMRPDRIQTERVLQFSFVPDPQIFVTAVVPMVDVVIQGVLAAALWDGVKLLFRQRRTPPAGDAHTPTKLTARIEHANKSTTFHLETNDYDIAAHAIDAIQEIPLESLEEPALEPAPPPASDHKILLWDKDRGAWLPKPITPPGCVSTPPDPSE